MSYANEKLYKGYLRRKMALIVSRVKVRQIMPHLPCLTDNDREEVEAKRETSGNYVAMQHLLDCMKRRENWPDEFITALEACEHTEMAAEIRAEYESLKGPSSPQPPSPPATVVQAHVHPAPSADPSPSLPESAGASRAAAAPPAQAAAPPELVAQASPPPESPPSPGPVTVAPSPRQETPPPSPQAPHHRATTPPPPPDRESPVHQEPVENSESDLLRVPGDEDVIPEETSAVDSGVSEVNDEVTPEPEVPVLQPETAAPCQPDPTVQTEPKVPVQDTTPPTTALVAEEMSEPIATQVTEDSPQTQAMDTISPPLDGTDGPRASLSGGDDDEDEDEDENDDEDDDEDDDACLSKPTQLISIQQNNETPAASEEEPYSGDSERLAISDPAPDSPEPVPQVAVAAACSDLAVDPEKTARASPPPCQENGVVEESVSFPHNEPEENHYESPCQSSLGEQEVLVNVVHVMEEPSIQNLDGQTSSALHNDKNASVHPSLERFDSRPQIVVESPSTVSPESSCLDSCDVHTEVVSQGEACVSQEPQAQILNGQAASALNKEPEPAPPAGAVAVSIENAPSGENCHLSEPGAVEALLELKPRAQEDPMEEAPASSVSSKTKYFLTAAGVGACALLVAWKLKH